VILGLRPEDIEDAALVANGDGSTLDVDVTLAEPMGAEVIAHFAVNADPVTESDSVAALVTAAGTDDARRYLQLVSADAKGRATLTARLSPRCGARTGAPLRLTVDVERLHFFDAETENSIY